MATTTECTNAVPTVEHIPEEEVVFTEGDDILTTEDGVSYEVGEGLDGEDIDLQGPHNWRQQLKPVCTKVQGQELKIPLPSPRKEDEVKSESTSPRILSRRLSREDRYDDAKIRERLKVTRKDSFGRSKGSTATRNHIPSTNYHPPSSPLTLSPAMSKRRSYSTSSESAFTRQVVNTKPVSPAVNRKKDKKQTLIPVFAGHVRRSSTSNITTDNCDGDVARRRVDKVLKARLYLLQLTGPNSFLIGGDSPSHKFRVIIGQQRCNCGKTPHCVHVLFVMLRVFQLNENDPRLWSKTLKNYEVEALFKDFHARRTSRIKDLMKRKASKSSISVEEESTTFEDKESTSTSEQDDDLKEVMDRDDEEDDEDEEEEGCPICLLEMVEGESLVECVNGCQNKLHHHCISIWFEECRRQGEPLNCPLCRAKWHTEHGVEVDPPKELPVPPNTRASSPQPTATHLERSPPETDEDAHLPQAEPIPPENQEQADRWIPVLGEDVVSYLFSKNWSVREIGLRQLSRIAVGKLLLGVGEGRSGVVLSPTRKASTHSMLDICLSVLAYMLADPVYKVFVGALRTLRTILSYTPCRDETQQSRLQSLMQPVVLTILWKCADSNRRTSQLSLSALQEVVRGQEGELALGKEIVRPGSMGLGGAGYLLRCLTEDPEVDEVQWQWLLGRLYMLDKLLEDHPAEFIIRPHEDAPGDHTLREPMKNYERVFSVLKFCVPYLNHSHIKVSRYARRVFYLSARLQAHNKTVLSEISVLLDGVDTSVEVHMKRKLLRVAEEFQLAQQVHHLVDNDAQAADVLEIPEEHLPQFNTPIISAASTPRCNSPVQDAHLQPIPSEINVNVNHFIHINTGLPAVPPNSPNQKVRTRAASATSHSESERSSGLPRRSHSRANSDVGCSIPTPPSTPQKRALRLEHRDTDSEVTVPTVTRPAGIAENDETVSVNGVRHTPQHTQTDRTKEVELVDACVGTSPVLKVRGIKPDLNISAIDSNFLQLSGVGPLLYPCDEEECDEAREKDGVDEDDLMVPEPELHFALSTEAAFDGPMNSTATAGALECDVLLEEEEEDENKDSRVATPSAGCLDTDDELMQLEGGEQGEVRDWLSSANATINTTSKTGMSTEDLSDLSPHTTMQISFKTEVATPHHSSGEASSADCPCKEEVEREEAAALVEALEKSSTAQDALPCVPGLMRTFSSETLTIHIQDEENNEGVQYLEGVHWRRGVILGTGAYSTCYQAQDVRTGSIMAVKQISFCRNTSDEQDKVITAVEEEIHMMAKLSHPNVVRILGATQQGCHFFMFVEWMPGGSLASLLARYGIFSSQVITSYTLQILRGLSYLHENHILHRDLKGANLLVDSTGQRLRIADFGAAARLATRATGAGEFKGQLLGTIAFMAPEVLRGENYGRSCDIWSVGCLIIEMHTGKPPWGAHDISNHLALIFRIASCVNSPPIPDNATPALKDLILRCLEVDRSERPPARELIKHPAFTMFTKR